MGLSPGPDSRERFPRAEEPQEGKGAIITVSAKPVMTKAHAAQHTAEVS